MSGIKYLKAFDKKQLFRFFVDGRFHSKYNGWIGYEKMEHGSVKAMINGMSYMLDNFDLTLGLKSSYILGLHKQCTFNVITQNLKSSPGDIRYLSGGMPFFKKTTTLEHLQEVLEDRKNDKTIVFNTKRFAKYANELDANELYQYLQKNDKLSYKPWYPNLTNDMKRALNHRKSLIDFYNAKHYIQKEIASRLEKIVDKFNFDIKNANTDDEKILVFAKVTRDLEMLHPFPDGNCRTFANVLLNHLLMFYGFAPAILINPNLDGEVSSKQFSKVIKDGIKNTHLLLKDPLAKLYNFSISSLSEKENSEFLEIANSFIVKLKNYKEIYLTSQILQNITNGKWYNENLYTRFTGVGSHTTIIKGGLYFCFTKDWKKQNKDIRQEIINASNKGVRAFIIDDARYLNITTKPILLVDDCDKQMSIIASFVRQNVDCQSVLVTGTIGKTGFKFQLHHCLKKQTKIHAFLNSINTKIPILRTLSSLEEDDKVEIVELSVGSNYHNTINRSKMIDPNICVFTDLDQNHMNIHKNIKTLVKAKASAITGLKDNGICIINSDATLYKELVNEIKNIKPNVNIITFGQNTTDKAKLIDSKFNNENFTWDIKANIDGIDLNYTLPIFHSHAPIQSLGVLLAIKYLGFDVKKAAIDYANNFKSFSSIGRLFKISFQNKNILFYDQSYRGAIKAMRSAFQDIKNMNLDKRKVFVIAGSSIKEDNEFTKSQHKEIAMMLNNCRVDRLYTTGPYTNYIYDNLDNKSIFIKHSDDFDELEIILKNDLQDNDFLFMMGSGDLYLGKLGAKVLEFGISEVIR